MYKTVRSVFISSFQVSLLRDLSKVLMGLFILTALSQIRVVLPFSPIPMTFGPQAAFIIGGLFSPGLAFITTATYITLGFVGLPILANFSFGFTPTAGYLIGYAIAAPCISYLFSRCRGDLSYWKSYFIIKVGMIIVYLCGLTYLSFWLKISLGMTTHEAWIKGLELGFLPHILPCIFFKSPIVVSIIKRFNNRAGN